MRKSNLPVNPSAGMFKKLLPYVLIAVFYTLFIWFFHRDAVTYRFNQNLVHDYLRSQDIEDPESKIHDRIFVSDSEIYIASGYLYAKGADPTAYNFQHPPLIKYLFGFSTLLTGNPFWVQIIFGLALLLLTYYLASKTLMIRIISVIPALLLLVDPVFGGMMNEALLDSGQAVFALGYIILVFFFPESFILQGVTLGLFAASKFWSTAILVVILVAFYKHFIAKNKLYYQKVFLSFIIAFLVFALTYIKSFVDAGGAFNIFAFLARDLRFMLTHNSATFIGGPIVLFVTGYFAPWWQSGVARAIDWTILWPVGLLGSLFLAFRTKMKDVKFFFCVLPIIYLLLMSTQVPFSRYFILFLPFIYIALSEIIIRVVYKVKK